MSPEYHIEGRFPGSKRILGIGPRKRTFTTLTTCEQMPAKEKQNNHSVWKGILDVNGKEIKGKVVFERDASDKPFKTEWELLNYLIKRFSVSYLRDKSRPAVSTGG